MFTQIFLKFKNRYEYWRKKIKIEELRLQSSCHVIFQKDKLLMPCFTRWDLRSRVQWELTTCTHRFLFCLLCLPVPVLKLHSTKGPPVKTAGTRKTIWNPLNSIHFACQVNTVKFPPSSDLTAEKQDTPQNLWWTLLFRNWFVFA